MKIDHVALFCRDLEAMRQFFLDHFEAVSNEQYHNLRTGLRTYILSFPDGGAKLELMQRPDTLDADPSKPNNRFCFPLDSYPKMQSLDKRVRAVSKH